ncbi:MAG TPA: MarR family transcriptional regulator [Pantanalinema sp.]
MRPLRALAEAYNAFAGAGARNMEAMGLTPAQFDVLATLGDTAGMTCKQLGEGTMITKGTLTGVLDRLEAKGLIRRTRGEQDCRQVFVRLTPEGEAVFQQTFQPHVDFLGSRMAHIPPEHQRQLTELLRELRRAFS